MFHKHSLLTGIYVLVTVKNKLMGMCWEWGYKRKKMELIQCNDNKRLFYSILSNTRCVNAVSELLIAEWYRGKCARVPMGCLGVFSAFFLFKKKKPLKNYEKLLTLATKFVLCVMKHGYHFCE